jgi:hypothetical protein
MDKNIHYHHSEPELYSNTITGENESNFTTSCFYINNSDSDITVVGRNNLPTMIPKSHIGYRLGTSFILRTVYRFTGNPYIVQVINNIQVYRSHYGNKQPDIELLVETMLNIYNGSRDIQVMSIALDRIIDTSIIKEHESVYIPEADILVQYGIYDVTTPHPFSIEGRAKLEYRSIVESKKVTGFFIEVIDNEYNIKSRYMYAAKDLLEVPVKQDKDRQSGVYCTYVKYDKLDKVHIDPEYYSFIDAEQQLGLYRTKEEAETGGNPEILSKNRHKEYDILLMKSKKELEESKLNFKKLETDSKHKLEELKHENDILKETIDINKHRRSDYYEERGQTRKDSSEVLKFLPVVVLGLVSIFSLLKSSKG